MRFLSKIWFWLSLILVFPFLYKLYVVHMEMRDWISEVEDKSEENESNLSDLAGEVQDLDTDVDDKVSRDDFDDAMNELGGRIDDCATEDALEDLKADIGSLTGERP